MRFFGVLLIIAGGVVLYWFAIRGKTLTQLEASFGNTTKNLSVNPVIGGTNPVSTGPGNVVSIVRGSGVHYGSGHSRVVP